MHFKAQILFDNFKNISYKVICNWNVYQEIPTALQIEIRNGTTSQSGGCRIQESIQ